MIAAVPRLLTFAPMVDSETARLVCRWYGLDYREDDHLFGWVSLLTVLHGGYGRVPLLHGGGLHLSGPRPIVDRFDPLAPPARRLLLPGGARAGIEADWAAYNGTLGGDLAVFAYFHLLPARELMIPIFAGPVPPAESRLTPHVYPQLCWLFGVLLRLTPQRAAAAEQGIRMAFAAMDRRLADGRRFLCGDRLTLGDIAFAAATAPLLQPAGYGARMPDVAAMPPAIRDTIGDLRQHGAVRYVERVYATIAEGGK